MINCDQKTQPLGFLVWASCGKDPGFNPRSLLAEAGRAHFSQAELDALDFDGPRPDAVLLGARWKELLRLAETICGLLPPGELGKCVLAATRDLFRGDADELASALEAGSILFHEGRIAGSWPETRGGAPRWVPR